MAHALLSPSSASRWTVCTPSARLEERLPESTSVYAEEGTFAHSLAELILRRPKGMIKELDELKAQIIDFYSKNGDPARAEAMYDDMFEHANAFAELVLEHKGKNDMMYIEQRLDMTAYIPEGFGTGDAGVISEPTMHMFDLKYGQGVKVEAKNNKQLMIYALGALEEYGLLYDIQEISMTIYQPRLDHVSTWTISREDLESWAENELKPKAQLAWEGKGKQVAGPHCKFCKVASTCRALAEHNLELAKYEFRDPNLLSLDEIAEILPQIETLTLWTKLIKDYALAQALEGKDIKGYKLVEGKSNRKYSDPAQVEAVLKENGFEDIYTEPELLGITALERRIKKANFAKLVAPLLVKPPGAPTLVDLSDKRPEWSAPESDFSSDFKDPVED